MARILVIDPTAAQEILAELTGTVTSWCMPPTAGGRATGGGWTAGG